MKIDRLIGILSVLLKQDRVTAPELAEKFEVSRRTINRDIEDLCRAGIPVVTTQGVGGGIRIMDGYKMDKTLLTSKDMQMILAGLRSLDSVSQGSDYSRLMERMEPGASGFVSGRDSILIDLSSWYKDSLAPKIETIQTAAAEKVKLSFTYYAPGGTGSRVIEPYYLVFRWSSWYVWGWCEKREDFRLFKLNRMTQVRALPERFSGRKVPLPDLSTEHIFPGGIRVKALFEPEVKWRLVEEFGPDCFEVQTDGKLLFNGDYTDRENLLCWLLSFGGKAELLEPKDIRNELLKIAESMVKVYQKAGETE